MVLSALAISSADAQTRKPTAQEVATIRDCATKYQDNVDEASGSVCVQSCRHIRFFDQT